MQAVADQSVTSGKTLPCRHKAVRAVGEGDNRQLMQRAEGVAAGQYDLDIQGAVLIGLHTGVVGPEGDCLPCDIDAGPAKALWEISPPRRLPAHGIYR